MKRFSFGVLFLLIIVILLIILKVWDQSGKQEQNRIRYEYVIKDPKP